MTFITGAGCAKPQSQLFSAVISVFFRRISGSAQSLRFLLASYGNFCYLSSQRANGPKGDLKTWRL